jgi:hypothetical protein
VAFRCGPDSSFTWSWPRKRFVEKGLSRIARRPFFFLI